MKIPRLILLGIALLNLIACGEDTTANSPNSSSSQSSSSEGANTSSSNTGTSSTTNPQSKCKSLTASQFCDERDGQAYGFVQIGTQTWMAQNLNYGKQVPASFQNNINNQDSTDFAEKYCYQDDSSQCQKMGGLYQQWEALQTPWPCRGPKDLNTSLPLCQSPKPVHQGICPSGWHIPTDEEWKTLETQLGFTPAERDTMSSKRGNYAQVLKSADFGGTNATGFTALGSGLINSVDGKSLYSGEKTCFWTASSQNYPIYRCLNNANASIDRNQMGEGNKGISIRCIKD